MDFKIFSLHPNFYNSFINTSLIARGIEHKIINLEIINWREKFGIGRYKQVDDKPFGGGDGMVLMAEPIYKGLLEKKAIGIQYKIPKIQTEHQNFIPKNPEYFKYWQKNSKKINSITISLTPRGYTLNQNTIQWLSQNFKQINILCGRYEGFDSRVSDMVDLEISLGNFVLNGGESASLCIIESISRLLPNFISKTSSVLHDSFSENVNQYLEQEEYILGSNNYKKTSFTYPNYLTSENIFDKKNYIKNTVPSIEHPIYTRSEVFNNYSTPKVLLSGNHKNIQKWRENWFYQK
jgi:tRNA (guanine37-N1)-methyltransferase